MHAEARAFLEYCASAFPHLYTGKVLDVGSADINGTNRQYFDGCEYTGCDVAPAPNVDVVCPCHLLPYAPGTFDVVVSSECFEHDKHWRLSLAKCVDMLKPGGLLVFTCASTGRAEHGTRRSSGCDSMTTRLVDDAEWQDYYANLTADDCRSAMNTGDFSYHAFYYNEASKDLYFVGVKARADPPAYEAPGVSVAEPKPIPCPLLVVMRLEHARELLGQGFRDRAVRMVARTHERAQAHMEDFPHPTVVLDMLSAVTCAPWHTTDDELRDAVDAALAYCRSLVSA